METAIALLATRGVGPARLRMIVAGLSRIGLPFAEALTEDGQEVLTASGVKELPDESAVDRARSVAEELREAKVKCLVWGDDKYGESSHPGRGGQLPAVLFARGDISILDRPAVGFSGSRSAGKEGLGVAQDSAGQLASKGINVVSGGAKGVDSASHVAALNAGGVTTIVLPEGLQSFRMRPEIGELVEENNALVLSEFHPAQTWQVSRAMQRNKAICGLGRALIVIEARAGGGTVDAGRTALEFGTPLFVVEYGKYGEHNEGNRALLEAGARSIRKSKTTGRANIEEVLAVLESGETRVAGGDDPTKLPEQLSLPDSRVQEISMPYQTKDRSK